MTNEHSTLNTEHSTSNEGQATRGDNKGTSARNTQHATRNTIITEQMVRDSGGDPNNCEEIKALQLAMSEAVEVADNIAVFVDSVSYEATKLYKPTINHRVHLQPILESLQLDQESQLRIVAYLLSFNSVDVIDAFRLEYLNSGKFGYDLNKIYQEAFKFSTSVGNDIALFELVTFAMNWNDVETHGRASVQDKKKV